jgi:hypothetical protein
MTSTPSGLAGQVVLTVKPAGVSGTLTWLSQILLVADVTVSLVDMVYSPASICLYQPEWFICLHDA